MGKHFRNLTKKVWRNLRKIPTDEIIIYLRKHPDVISNYNSFSTQTQGSISKEISKNVFEKMFRLYIQGKSFSYAKDFNFEKILPSRTIDKNKSDLEQI